MEKELLGQEQLGWEFSGCSGHQSLPSADRVRNSLLGSPHMAKKTFKTEKRNCQTDSGGNEAWGAKKDLLHPDLGKEILFAPHRQLQHKLCEEAARPGEAGCKLMRIR